MDIRAGATDTQEDRHYVARIRSSRNAPGLDVSFEHSFRSHCSVRLYRSGYGDSAQSNIPEEMFLYLDISQPQQCALVPEMSE